MPTPPVAAATAIGASHSRSNDDRLVRHVLGNIIDVYAVDPFVEFLNRLAKGDAGHNPTLEYFSSSQFPRFVTLAEALAAAGDTSLVVTDAGGLTADLALQDTLTGEMIMINSISGTTLTIAARGGYGGGAPRALAVGDTLKIIAVGRKEGQAALSPIGILPRKHQNVFQQFEQVSGITDIAKATMWYGASQADYNTRQTIAEYNKRRAAAVYFNYGADVTETDQKRRLLGGLREIYEDADMVEDAGGAFTYSEFMDMMTRPARVGDGDVKHFMGVASYNVINIMVRWLLEKHQADHMVTTKYGFKLNRVIGPGWIMDLGRSECFEDDDEYSTWLMISNLKYVRLHAYRDLALKVHRMIQGPAKDGHHQENDQWTSTETISHRMPESGLIVKNITS